MHTFLLRLERIRIDGSPPHLRGKWLCGVEALSHTLPQAGVHTLAGQGSAFRWGLEPSARVRA
jgi:hypothetical protein